MRYVVCVKYVPVLSQLRFDPETRRLVREGVRGEASSFDVRALLGALRLRDADRGVHVCDAAVAGSDTLATARVLAAALRREQADLILLGRASVDAETG